jgi:hypothetical protein
MLSLAALLEVRQIETNKFKVCKKHLMGRITLYALLKEDIGFFQRVYINTHHEISHQIITYQRGFRAFGRIILQTCLYIIKVRGHETYTRIVAILIVFIGRNITTDLHYKSTSLCLLSLSFGML